MAAPALGYSLRDLWSSLHHESLSLQRTGSSSLARVRAWARLHWACTVLATGPPRGVSDTPLFNVCVTFHPCVFSPVDGHLDCFQFWNITTRAVVNPCIYLLVWDGLLVNGFSGVPDDVWAEGKCRTVRGDKRSACLQRGKVDLDRRRAHHPLEEHREGLFFRSQFPAYFLWPPCLKPSAPGRSCSALGPQASRICPRCRRLWRCAVTLSRGFW